LIVCRVLRYAALMLLWGGSAYVAVIAPGPLGLIVWRRLRPLWLAAAAVALIGTIAALLLQSGNIGEGWPDAFNATLVRNVLSETGYGRAWLVQAVTALLLFVAVVTRRAAPATITAYAAALALGALALTGHSAMQTGWVGFGAKVNDAIHLLAAGAWIGALVALVASLPARRDAMLHDAVDAALGRFSLFGLFAVAAIAGTGIVNTLIILGGLPTDWSSPYQALLAAKIGLFLLMLALAASNRYRVQEARPRDERKRLRAIRMTSAAELALGAAILVVVAFFGTFDPA
jgi:putative copper resistance protein D